ncbi:MAG: YigZ family protein [Ferruginibacter sp.]
MKTFYYTIEQEAKAEYKDRGSKFIAYAFPVAEAIQVKTKLQQLKKEHPKAVHHCYGYRIGMDENNFRAVDDGEPAGTAGKPILGQIDNRGLTNTCIIVVRYFGGSLLGVPGLINAYKTASSLALQVVPIISKPVMKYFILEFDYTKMNDVMQILKKYNAEVKENVLQLFSTLRVGIPQHQLTECFYHLENLRDVKYIAEN